MDLEGYACLPTMHSAAARLGYGSQPKTLIPSRSYHMAVTTEYQFQDATEGLDPSSCFP